MTTRQTNQFAGLLRRAVQSVLDAGLSDPRLDAVITVTKVSVDTPPRQAHVSVSVMPERHESRVLHGLKDASRYIRREAGDLLDTHRMPELHFRIDRSLKRQTAVLETLAKLREDEGEGGARNRGGWGQPGGDNMSETSGSEPANIERESTGEQD